MPDHFSKAMPIVKFWPSDEIGHGWIGQMLPRHAWTRIERAKHTLGPCKKLDVFHQKEGTGSSTEALFHLHMGLGPCVSGCNQLYTYCRRSQWKKSRRGGKVNLFVGGSPSRLKTLVLLIAELYKVQTRGNLCIPRGKKNGANYKNYKQRDCNLSLAKKNIRNFLTDKVTLLSKLSEG